MSATALTNHPIAFVPKGPAVIQSFINWEEFKFEIKEHSLSSMQKSLIRSQHLQDTGLSCVIDSEAAQWNNRKSYIEKILADVVTNCPKDEPLALISLGADRLLIEYILGKTLIQKGFRPTFFLVDPMYAFSESEQLKAMVGIIKEFRAHMEAVFFIKYKEPMSSENLRFLSRSQQIGKCFPKGSNVIILESLPPYGEPLKEICKTQAIEKSKEDLLAGGMIVPSKHANSIAFFPHPMLSTLQNAGAKFNFAIPLGILKNLNTGKNFYVDWGCKIRTDGIFRLTFSNYAEFIKQTTFDEATKQKYMDIIPEFKKNLEKGLSQQIALCLKKNADGKLSQANISSFLEDIKTAIQTIIALTDCFFTADYVIDREEAITLIAADASHHYRKIFTFLADAQAGYKVGVEEI